MARDAGISVPFANRGMFVSFGVFIQTVLSCLINGIIAQTVYTRNNRKITYKKRGERDGI